MRSDDFNNLVPEPVDLVKSLRGLGYSLKTALADIVDNCIAAEASEVRILFHWQQARSVISVTDNGRGMSPSKLHDAMRLGRVPSSARAASDLGSFGMGLKTASWSQCRSVTVRSKTESDTATLFRWDLDHVETTNTWHVLDDPRPGSQGFAATIDSQKAGTVVVWEDLDTLLRRGCLASSSAFWVEADAVSRHLGMTFHRYIETGRVKIFLNGDAIPSWDPMLSRHSFRRESPSEWIRDENGHKARFTGYILPAKVRFATDAEYEAAGGPGGWNKGQGFYLYRADRLIVAGGWLGLGRAAKEWKVDPAFRTVRMSLDITNASDLDWGIDVLKETAVPPLAFHRRLTQLADAMRRRARAIESSETPKKSKATAEGSPWKATELGAAVRYRIDRRHPAVKEAFGAAGAGRAEVKRLLDLLDQTAPMQPYGSLPAPPEVRIGRSAQEEAAVSLAKTIAFTLIKGTGMTPEMALERLLAMPEFERRPDLAAEAVESTKEDDRP